LKNTFVPGAVELAEEHNVLFGGYAFMSGQTKMTSVIAALRYNEIAYHPLP